jgi:hypothetical protein
MPYNPGISYHGGEYIAQGILTAAGSISDAMKKKAEEDRQLKREADRYASILKGAGVPAGRVAAMSLGEMMGEVDNLTLKRAGEIHQAKLDQFRAEMQNQTADRKALQLSGGDPAAYLRSGGGDPSAVGAMVGMGGLEMQREHLALSREGADRAARKDALARRMMMQDRMAMQQAVNPTGPLAPEVQAMRPEQRYAAMGGGDAEMVKLLAGNQAEAGFSTQEMGVPKPIPGMPNAVFVPVSRQSGQIVQSVPTQGALPPIGHVINSEIGIPLVFQGRSDSNGNPIYESAPQDNFKLSDIIMLRTMQIDPKELNEYRQALAPSARAGKAGAKGFSWEGLEE